jgi:hypothetical protein
MRCRLFTLLSAVSLVLCVATSSLAVASCEDVDAGALTLWPDRVRVTLEETPVGSDYFEPAAPDADAPGASCRARFTSPRT